jgi:hypothetical protein
MVAPVRLEDVMQANHLRTLEGLHTCEPAKVLSYNAAKQTADVQPVNKRRYTDADTGEVFYETRPAVPSVPIGWLMAGGFGLCLPLEAGDHVWLIYAQESISEWREADQDSEPTDAGRLTDSHPFAIPAAFPVGKEFAQTTKPGAFFGHKNGNGLHVQSSTAELKVNATVLELTSAAAGLKSAMVELGNAPSTGVATQLTLAPFFAALTAYTAAEITAWAALAAFAAQPSVAAISAGTATPLATAAGAMAAVLGGLAGVCSAGPANFCTTVKAGP